MTGGNGRGVVSRSNGHIHHFYSIGQHTINCYREAHRVGHVVHDVTLEYIAQMVAQFLLKKNYQSMIFPTTGLHPGLKGKTEREIWEDGNSLFNYTFGPFSTDMLKQGLDWVSLVLTT